MRKPRRFEIDNFVRGMRRDAGVVQDDIWALRTLQNYEPVYDGPRVYLRMRKGRSRWNDTELTAPATQLFHFVDLQNRELLLGIVDDKWTAIAQTGTHSELSSIDSTARRPTAQFGSRAIFGVGDGDNDDTGLRWTDYDTVTAGVDGSYRLGIARPEQTPYTTAVAPQGHTTGTMTNTLYLNTDTQYKVAFRFTLTSTTRISAIHLSSARASAATAPGNIRVKIYTDNGGEPSDTLADEDAVSNWWQVSLFTPYPPPTIADSLKAYTMRRAFELDAGTYWAVVEADDTYRDNYVGGGGTPFYAIIGSSSGSTNSAFWDTTSSTWVGVNHTPIYQIGGLDDSKYYDYVYTYYNSTYGIESRPSDHVRVDPTATASAVTLSFAAPADPQVDKIRLYRRQVENIDDTEADITDTYKLVGETDWTTAFVDTVVTEHLGAELQSQDHYLYDEVNDEEGEIRDSALKPNVVAVWKGRIWFAEKNGNVLYFSKRLEQDSALGVTGDSVPDFFPLENYIEMPVPSAIIGLAPLGNAQMADYFENESVWVVWGADEPMNPPSDISIREVLTDSGLIAPAALASLRGRHVYLSKAGVIAFAGVGNVEVLSHPIQSIFDEIEYQYITDSVVASLGDEVWVLVDDDNDGTMESIYILDIRPTVAAWRVYRYGLGFNDIVARQTSSGSGFATVLAADAASNYVYELNAGDTDDGNPIVGIIETHDINAPIRLVVTGVDIQALYPYTPATYVVSVITHTGKEYDFNMTPTSSEDIYGHSIGCSVTSPYRARVRLMQASTHQDELRGIVVKYVEF